MLITLFKSYSFCLLFVFRKMAPTEIFLNPKTIFHFVYRGVLVENILKNFRFLCRSQHCQNVFKSFVMIKETGIFGAEFFCSDVKIDGTKSKTFLFVLIVSSRESRHLLDK
jgi:hypothetical protein